MTAPAPAALVLEDGTIHRGTAYGATGVALGEAVFATGMTGYQETLTDPSYAGQIVVQTAPHIGNTGVNAEDAESRRMWPAGYAVRAASRTVSNWRAEGSLDAQLERDGIVGIAGVDTRAITRRLRDAGSMRAGVFSGDALADDATMLAAVRESPQMAGRSLADVVTTPEAYRLPATGEPIGTLAVLDLGVKASTLRFLQEQGFDLVVLPQSATLEEVLAHEPIAAFYSNGPGDPAASDSQVELLQGLLREDLPFFGICFGNQLLGRALGFGTYKLPFGHRGINQPVLDKATGRVEITSQNHGFAVDAPLHEELASPAGFGRVEVSHWSLNDEVVEGLRALDIPAFSVQYHPESAAGPNDARHLFSRFRELVLEHRAATATHSEQKDA
ncbi:glutamine-hydrolyzing carbamoyl-phosphate synthase small subunit [Agrococcus sediminis]|uniref:Carbamoyl phosphate synthase small chain n=1 Tax=Agrococcus sediminis TaxID=2599924 RepID=A0A5M8QG86_9MICO|nr:glutamine-hydrolyzing carbamoyl-phosphate synthase small subunit [Agrococcus sediminis]KAA6433756.1 glutamine-hydrolyzing carbamoyl-phosphate synthase small subunit [Agrococcus sediminis]RWR21619.1 carbamoyl-phosphate synthase small subunit [Agrococcus lahaulensis]